MVGNKLFELGLNGPKKKKMRIGYDFLIGQMTQERSEMDSELDPKKMIQYICVINITWLPLMKHTMLVKKITC